VIAGPRHFAALAGRLRWDPQALDSGSDAVAFAELEPRRRGRLTALLAGFCVAEWSVADQLAPFGPAARDEDTAAVFAAQRADEARHAAWFDRVAESVLRVGGEDAESRREAARALAPAELADLFERRLPAMAAALAAGQAELAEAVALYHLVLEGVVLSAGQRALLDDLADGALPTVRAGIELVERDERWHVGFGLRCLLERRPSPRQAADLLAAGEAAARAWGAAVPEAIRRQVGAQHRRRLAAIGLVPAPSPAHVTAGPAA
jgi:ribonucleoside-diphosphate reductase beta chain